ncbi:MAG: hypothetical protein LBP56_03020 [Odoribacteraceae bacterium]|jgi:hypothetical protein|nr:hypothetical protein [Odoribacteraceae bacterium]
MKTTKFNEEFFAEVREAEVWKMLFEERDFLWTEELIDRYQDRIEWKLLSENRSVQWTASMLEKYKDKLDWDKLSDGCNEYLYSVENLRKYRSRWNWSSLSANSSVNWTLEKVEEFKDLIDWSELIDNYNHDSLFTLDFFEKYKEYIPVVSFQDSSLWKHILEIYKKRLIEEILSR